MNDKKRLRKLNWQLFLLGLFKIPYIRFSGIRLTAFSEDIVEARIKLRRRNKNHLGSMYFAALSVGADVTAGIHAFYFAYKYSSAVSFAFKGMQAEYLKRVESDCRFLCREGRTVEAAVKESIGTGERINLPIFVEAFNTFDEKVAAFEMILSVKCKAKAAG